MSASVHLADIGSLPSDVRFWVPAQPVDATLYPEGGMGSLAACARPWDSNPSRENEIECCVDRLRPPPKADIAPFSAIVFAGTMPCPNLRGGNETARVHHASRRSDSRVAACRARTAGRAR